MGGWVGWVAGEIRNSASNLVKVEVKVEVESELGNKLYTS